MNKEIFKKEFCIYVRNGRNSPYILSPYSSFQDAQIALNNIIEFEERRGRFFYVDNDFYDNKYPPNMYGKYFCSQERNVSEWSKYKSLYSSETKNKNGKIIIFRQKLK